MKTRVFQRLLSLVLCLALVLTLLGAGTVFADNEIWYEDPTGWINWGHVTYKTATVSGKTYVLNWGVRGELCRFRSAYARDFYPDLYGGQGFDWAYDLMAAYEGGTGQDDAISSDLYAQLHSFLEGKQTFQTSYNGTRDLYKYTDCMVSNSNYISSFYSGIKLNGAWDSGKTWNREHTWPNSKCGAPMENDIMMLRPTSVKENSSRGNTAYGQSSGFYNPNSEAGTTGLDLRGDCARICLYCYVRWTENADFMWGAPGVMESLDVLLQWMEEDPVDTWEMGRNDAVQSITGVRNCFVDYPELAWALFGREVPENYPTPFREDHNNFVSVPAILDARSCDEAKGTVTLKGWAVDCSPAAGYYASGFDVYDINGQTLLEQDDWSVFHWENDHQKLLYCPVTEADYLVEIHFTPIGQEDPCPTGHTLDRDNIQVVTAPGCLTSGTGLAACIRCGIQKEVLLESLGHAWDGVLTRPATMDEPGEMTYTCTRCGDRYTEPVAFRFDDVQNPGAYYYEPVYWALHHEPRITSGTSGTTFSPGANCTRAQVMTFLWNAMGQPEPASADNPFTDVKPGKYYYDAVLWAYSHDPQITGGMSAASFGVNSLCTRAQVVMFLWTAAGKPEPATSDNPFTDVKSTDYFYKAVLWAVENGVTGGTSPTTFSPKKTCTRGQVVTFLYKALGQ